MDDIWRYLENHVGPLLLVAIGLAGLSLLISLPQFLSVRRLLRPLRGVAAGGEISANLLSQLAGMAEDHETRLQKFSSVLDGLLQDGRSHLKRIGLVRYDAVDGITGHQSFSLCLLDGEANGVLITHLTFKTNTRGYAVGITKGEPVRELGEEEMRAMNEALAKG